MPYTELGKAVMLAGPGLRAAISHMSLHSGPPLEGHELPAGIYRRGSVELRDPAGGEMRSDGPIRLDVPEGSRVEFAAFWSEPTGGALLAWAKAPAKSFRGRGVYEVDMAVFDLNLDEE